MTKAETPLPRDFVRLAEVAPDVRQDMRYADAGNFTGRTVPGYSKPVCILARPVALALQRVQARLAPQGLSLVVFDCYRPRRAVLAFLGWAQRPAESAEARWFWPRIAKSDIVQQGYVARQSTHSLGTAVDLSIVRANAEAETGRPRLPVLTGPCHLSANDRGPTGALDMGTSFDCFDVASHTAHANVGVGAKANRALLVREMTAEGFRNYPREWWHFSMSVPGFEQAQDFEVE
ncbi:MAG: M15 family metallopeptidase [Hyphomicrobiaceae bacterium]